MSRSRTEHRGMIHCCWPEHSETYSTLTTATRPDRPGEPRPKAWVSGRCHRREVGACDGEATERAASPGLAPGRAAGVSVKYPRAGVAGVRGVAPRVKQRGMTRWR